MIRMFTYRPLAPSERALTRRRREGGFTMTELMIAVAITGIMVGIAIPSVLAWMPGVYLSDASGDLKSGVIRARSMAIKGGLEHRLQFNTNLATYQIDQGNQVENATAWLRAYGPFTLANEVEYQSFTVGMETSSDGPFLRFGIDGSLSTNQNEMVVTLVNSKGDTSLLSVQRRTGHPTVSEGTTL